MPLGGSGEKQETVLPVSKERAKPLMQTSSHVDRVAALDLDTSPSLDSTGVTPS
jgi:hypothetical protein